MESSFTSDVRRFGEPCKIRPTFRSFGNAGVWNGHPGRIATCLRRSRQLDRPLPNFSGTGKRRYTDAEELYKRALVVFEKAVGVKHPDALKCAGRYAALLRELDRGDEVFALQSRFGEQLEREG